MTSARTVWLTVVFAVSLTAGLVLLFVFMPRASSDVSRPVYVASTGSAQDPEFSSHSYGILVDVGSSGSKVHVYHWPPHEGDPSRLLDIQPLSDEYGVPLMKKVEPGITQFLDSPARCYTSLQPLLTFALNHIPPHKHRQTSLYVLCTAGMRMASERQQREVIDHLQLRITEDFPFYLPQDGIEVISGQMEGVYSWIAINYLLGYFQPDTHDHSSASGSNSSLAVSTVGSLDMGGGSLQIAFEIPQHMEAPASDVVDINLGCGMADAQHRHRVYLGSYLGYGTNEARRRYYKQLTSQFRNSSSTDSFPVSMTLREPCLPLGIVENMTNGGRLRGLGDFHACRRALLPLLQGDTDCEDRSCYREPFQPPPFPFTSREFYATSEFWYTMRDVLRLGGDYSASRFDRAADEYCQTMWNVLEDRFHRHLYPYADSYRLKSQCIKSAWLSLVLHEGLGFPREGLALHSVSSVQGVTVHWPLGALLYHTRYLPLREIQLHHFHHPSSYSGPWGSDSDGLLASFTHSSFLLPLVVVAIVMAILVLCRHRRPHRYGNTCSTSRSFPLGRAVSLASLLPSSTSHTSLSRNYSSNRISSSMTSATSSNY